MSSYVKIISNSRISIAYNNKGIFLDHHLIIFRKVSSRFCFKSSHLVIQAKETSAIMDFASLRSDEKEEW
jgi:hypothetical protein